MSSRVHTTNPAEILCNSMVTAADKGVSINNKTYGYCHLFYANKECPYKDCVPRPDAGITRARAGGRRGGGREHVTPVKPRARNYNEGD